MNEITMDQVRRKLKKEGLFVRTIKGAYGEKLYLVADENNCLQSNERGMSFEELVEYAEMN